VNTKTRKDSQGAHDYPAVPSSFEQTVYLGFYLPGERVVLKPVGNDPDDVPPPAVSYRLAQMFETQ